MQFLPEPKGAGLDRLATQVAWHTGRGEASAEVRERTLRAVRALRLAFGWNVEQEFGTTGGKSGVATSLRRAFGRSAPAGTDYLGLLRGVAALDGMWRADSRFDGLGPFTLDLLHRVVEAHPEGGRSASQAGYAAVLGKAGAAAVRQPSSPTSSPSRPWRGPRRGHSGWT